MTPTTAMFNVSHMASAMLGRALEIRRGWPGRTKRTRLLAPLTSRSIEISEATTPWMKKAAKPTTSTQVRGGRRSEAGGDTAIVLHSCCFLGGAVHTDHSGIKGVQLVQVRIPDRRVDLDAPGLHADDTIRILAGKVQLVAACTACSALPRARCATGDPVPRARPSGSRLAIGSSAITSFGACISIRAIATRCCWPPDSSEGRCSARSAIPTRSRLSIALPRSSAEAVRLRQDKSPSRCRPMAPSRTFWKALSCGTRLNWLKDVAHAAVGSGATADPSRPTPFHPGCEPVPDCSFSRPFRLRMKRGLATSIRAQKYDALTDGDIRKRPRAGLRGCRS